MQSPAAPLFEEAVIAPVIQVKALPKLLLVDDHPENLTVLKAVLKNQEYDLITALSGMAALDLVSQHVFDLILLDIMMPEMDGFEVCRILKEDPDYTGIPVIFITAKTDFESVVQGYELGAVDYVTKPFNPAILRARIKNQLRLRRAELELQKTVVRLEKEVAVRVQVERRLRQREKELERFALLDGLTQIANRRKFDEYLRFQWANKKRAKEPISMIMGDIDFFKQFNDRYGHPAGDKCLQDVAQALSRSLKRPEDVACRYGGEEFGLILPSTPLEGALIIAERIQALVAELAIPHESSKVCPHVTLSLGVACLLPEGEDEMETLIRKADKMLYQAKGNGRNRVESA